MLGLLPVRTPRTSVALLLPLCFRNRTTFQAFQQSVAGAGGSAVFGRGTLFFTRGEQLLGDVVALGARQGGGQRDNYVCGEESS